MSHSAADSGRATNSSGRRSAGTAKSAATAAAASAAYLTVSETFPIEIRALTIAVFYAIGTALGGVAAPAIFGRLIESGSRESVFLGYAFAAVLMLAAAAVAALFAVPAERRPLELVARPLSAAE